MSWSMSSVVRTTTGTTMMARANTPAQPEKPPIGSTTSWYTNRPIRMDGADSSTSDTKRTALPSAEPRAYSAR